jgi:acetyl-CoA carboxylase carboxyltransferase component
MKTHMAAARFTVISPVAGTLVSVDVAAGQTLAAGTQLAILEAMKMEFPVTLDDGGRVHEVLAAAGELVALGQPLFHIERVEQPAPRAEAAAPVDATQIRADLAEVIARHAVGLDAARPEAVARRRKTGQRTARENISDLCDAESFIEYGALVVAAQRTRKSVEELIRTTPADGLIAGIGTINASRFGPERSRALVLAYDYTVLAGTQGFMNHKKTDRVLELAERWHLPIVAFAEGGGGRPGDVDINAVAGLDLTTFAKFAALSAAVPRISIVSGRCFAGNAALPGTADVIIATANANLGMGGPAMIEGGGLGVFPPEAVGPMDVQSRNGVIDVLVRDEAEAVHMAKQYLSYFQGPTEGYRCADQTALRSVIPENRLRVYDIRQVIRTLVDEDSLLELRAGFGKGLVTALVRIEGQPFGLIANNPTHLGGALDADASDKDARFLQLCDAFDLPLISLVDTPGFMVGPEAEKTALVRHVSRLFVTAASMTVPTFVIVLRKSYGLGAQAMSGGSFRSPFFAASWPSGEFGAMGLEGGVRLGYRKELESIADAAQRERAFETMVAAAYERGKALNTATYFEIDAVIDPKETRHWIIRGLHSSGPRPPRQGKKRPFIDTW